MTDEKKIMVITNRPIRWNKSLYDVITLLDMVNEYKNRGENETNILLEEEKKYKQEEIELEIKELENEIENLNTQLNGNIKEINDIRKKIIEYKKGKKQDQDPKLKPELDAKIKEQERIKDEITKIKDKMNEKRSNKSEIELKIKKLEAEKEDFKKSDNYNTRSKKYEEINKELDILKEKKKKEDAEKKKKDEEEQLKYKTVRKNKVNNIIIIDDTLTNTDIEMFFQVHKLNLFDLIRDYYINKDAYAMLIKPISINLEKEDWFKKGVFRFLKNKVYDIYSNKEDFELKVFFKNNKNVTEFKRQVKNALPGDNFEQNYQIYKEKKYSDANQKDIEIVTEIIHNVKEYETFIQNRNKFANFVKSGIYNDNFSLKIQEAENHKYSKDILEKIKKEYPYSIPYTDTNPLIIYYVIVLHNKLTKDPAFENRRPEIANNIGIFSNNMKGIIIQSASFTKIPNYDAVKLFKEDTDKYYGWMKAEDDINIKAKFNGKKIYETHMKNMRSIINNLKVKKLVGGRETKKKRKKSLNKTMSKKI